MTNDEASQADRRKSPRVDLSFSVDYSFSDPATRYNVMGQALAINVSSEGVCVRFDEPAVLLHGGLMNLTLNLPKGAAPVLAKGQVRWSKAFDGGSRTGVMLTLTRDKRRFRQCIYGGNGSRLGSAT